MGIQNFNYERYIDESYFAVLGITGVGKSSFLNALINEEKCEVGHEGKSQTKSAEIINFVYNHHLYYAIDTPGLDDDEDSDDDDENVKKIEKILQRSPKIKCLLIVMPYNNIRLTRSLRKAIIIFMKKFPIEDFWNHIIIIHSWSNPNDTNYINFKNNKNKQTFYDKIKSNKNIMEFMKNKKIILPSKLEEFYIDSVTGKNIEIIEKSFKLIKEIIYKTEYMFPEVKRGQISNEVIPSKNKGFFIVKTFQIVQITDYDNIKRTFKQKLAEEERKPSNAELKRTEVIKEFDHEDEVQWYDIISIGISWLLRKTKIYKIYEKNYYEICGQEVEGEKIFKKKIWE